MIDAPPPRAEPAALIAKALRHHGAGDLETADALYREVLRTHPEHPDALHLHGVVAHQRGRHQQAVDSITRAVSIRPGNAAFLNNLGEAYRAQRQFAAAIDCYRRALSANPGDANALNNLGMALHHTHRFDEAERAFLEALSARAGDPEVAVNMGNMHRDRGDLPRAMACYRQAIQAAPGFAPAHAWLGVTLYEMGQGEAAVEALTRATDLAPLDVEAHNNLKRVRWNLDQPSHLHDSFRRACEQLPGVAETHMNLAESLILNGSYTEGAAAAKRALSLAPDSARAHSLLGRALDGAGRAIELDPQDALLREEYGNALLAYRRFREAAQVLEPGHLAAPRRSGILAHLTIALEELEDPALGELVDYERFVMPRLIDVPPGFPDLESFNAALHDELAAQHLTPNHALEQTMRGGTQTLNNLFQNPTGLVAVLKRQIQKVVDRYVAELPADPSHPFTRYANPDYVFTGAWSTILRGGGYDGSHIHNEGWLSGTYYVRTPDLSEQQRAAGEGHIQFGEPPARFASAKNMVRRMVAPQVGLAVLFPSFYWHGVRPFTGTGIRHSVSYDII